MEFKKVFRGYDPKQVDKFIADTAERESSTRRAQRERIVELTDENYNLRERIVELQRRQNDVTEAMIVAQRVASEIEQNAKEHADKALLEAKKFYATWQAYSKTIVASFTEDELYAFNNLERKIGDVIRNYERRLNAEKDEIPPVIDANAEKTADKSDDVLPAEKTAEEDDSAQKPAPKPAKKPKKSAEDFVKLMEQAADELNDKSKRAEQQSKPSKPANPITRVEQASGQSVDLKELLRPEQTLEELCSDLGLIDNDDTTE